MSDYLLTSSSSNVMHDNDTPRQSPVGLLTCVSWYGFIGCTRSLRSLRRCGTNRVSHVCVKNVVKMTNS